MSDVIRDLIISGFALAIVVRCGCVLNRMKRKRIHSWPLGASYIGLGISAFAVAVSPLYVMEWVGYDTIVIFTACVLVFDPRLWRRESR
ncbi:MAG TPA: hypothetical protein VJ797_15790 [Burkholderiales bacterium]|nr:hypothetical protein [Burkholderiales bacterium]